MSDLIEQGITPETTVAQEVAKVATVKPRGKKGTEAIVPVVEPEAHGTVKAPEGDVVVRVLMDMDHEVRLHPKSDNGLLMFHVVDKVIYLNGRIKAPKNIAIIPREDFDRAYDEVKAFKGWVDSGKLVKLENIPDNYYDATERFGVLNAAVDEAKKLADEAKKLVNDKDAEIEALKKRLLEFGAKL